MTNVQIDPAVDTTRRQWLQALAAAPLVASATAPKSAKAAIKTSARIVIAGSGLGGIAVANRLTQLLDGGKITIIDRKEEHNYQPGYTLVASGVWPVSKVRDRNADFLPAGIEWVKDMVAHFDPVANTVVTASGQRIPYDFLVVATGVHLDYAQITGMDVSAIGREGLTSVYPSPEAAQATWAAMQTFTARGGNAVMTLPATPLKCAGAPLKMTFMLGDRLAKAGTLGTSKIHFESALGNVFGVKVVNDNVLQRWQGLGIDVDFSRKLTAIDIGARRATFALSEGETKEMSYDFIHVVPPTRAPDAVTCGFNLIQRGILVIRASPLCPARGAWCSMRAGGHARSWRRPTRSTRSSPARPLQPGSASGPGPRCRPRHSGGGASTRSARARTPPEADHATGSRSGTGRRYPPPPCDAPRRDDPYGPHSRAAAARSAPTPHH